LFVARTFSSRIVERLVEGHFATTATIRELKVRATSRSTIQQATGREIGQLQTLREFDLSHPAVQAKLKERYGNRIPLTEKVISPVRMFESEELVMVR